MSRKDYNENIKVLKKVRILYLANKHHFRGKTQPDYDSIPLSDDDLVDCILFDKILSDIKHKQKEKTDTIQKFLNENKLKVKETQEQMGVDSEKIKKTIEHSVLVTQLNHRMEKNNREQFKSQYIFKNLYLTFVKQDNQEHQKRAANFKLKYNEITKPHMSGNPNHQNYKERLEREMQKFNGKITVGEGSETQSQVTDGTRATKQSGSQKNYKQQRNGSPGLDELDEAATMEHDEVQEDDGEDDQDKMDRDDDEYIELVTQKKQEKKWDTSECYIDPVTKEKFNPEKKFGIIESNSLLYDNVTTSYPLNLPTDYYQKYITSQMPSKESGNGKWFIRPHHLETLT